MSTKDKLHDRQVILQMPSHLIGTFAICTSPTINLVFPMNFAYLLSSISLETTVIPRRIKKGYVNFWGANKVYYGRCANDKLPL